MSGKFRSTIRTSVADLEAEEGDVPVENVARRCRGLAFALEEKDNLEPQVVVNAQHRVPAAGKECSMEGASEVDKEYSSTSIGLTICLLWHGESRYPDFEALQRLDLHTRLLHCRRPGRLAHDVLAGVPEEMADLQNVARGLPRCYEGFRRVRPLSLPASGEISPGLHLEQILITPESLENWRLADVSRINDRHRRLHAPPRIQRPCHGFRRDEVVTHQTGGTWATRLSISSCVSS